MKGPTFSVITPTRSKPSILKRALDSVKKQTYEGEYEHIVVHDRINPDVEKLMTLAYPEVTFIQHKEIMERLYSYNDGMNASKNDWICYLDDDDEYAPFYLEFIAKAIEKYPEYKVFNFGGLITNLRDCWIRARSVVPFEQKIEAPVQSGDIVNGQFVFHRSCLKKTGLFPETKNIYQFADLAKIPGYSSKIKVLGNPWGQDFYMMYKLTRHYISKPLDIYLYICHLRGTE